MPLPSFKKRLIYFVVFAACFLIAVPLLLFYSLGYDLGSNLAIFKTGGIYIYSSESGASIFVDEKLDSKTSIFEKGVLVKNLKPDTYSVRVSKEEFVDWKKNLEVKEERVTEGYPFFVPESPEIVEVPQKIRSGKATSTPLIDNPEYLKIEALFKEEVKTSPSTSSSNTVKNVKSATTTASGISQATTTPEVSKGKLSLIKRNANGGEILDSVWAGGSGNIPFFFCLNYEKDCENSLIIYRGKKINEVAFYPDRNDVILIGDMDKILIAELDMRSPQNIIELYKSPKGETIDWRYIDNENIAVKENLKYKKVRITLE